MSFSSFIDIGNPYGHIASSKTVLELNGEVSNALWGLVNKESPDMWQSLQHQQPLPWKHPAPHDDICDALKLINNFWKDTPDD